MTYFEPMFVSHIMPIKGINDADTLKIIAMRARTLNVNESVAFIYNGCSYTIEKKSWDAGHIVKSPKGTECLTIRAISSKWNCKVICGKIPSTRDLLRAILKITIMEVHES